MSTIKIHSVTDGKHWAITVEKIVCPVCQAHYGWPCVASPGRKPGISRPGIPLTRMPLNSVHAARVLAAGHNVKVI